MDKLNERLIYKTDYDKKLDNGTYIEVATYKASNSCKYTLIEEVTKMDEDENIIACNYLITTEAKGKNRGKIYISDTTQSFNPVDAKNELSSQKSAQIEQTRIYKWFVYSVEKMIEYRKAEDLKWALAVQQNNIKHEQDIQQRKDNDKKIDWDENSLEAHSTFDDDSFNAATGNGVNSYTTNGRDMKYAHCHVMTSFKQVGSVLSFYANNRNAEKLPFYISIDNPAPDQFLKNIATELIRNEAKAWSGAAKDTIRTFVGGRHEGEIVDYRYRKSTYATKDNFQSQGANDKLLRKYFNLFPEDDIYDLVIYEHRENDYDSYEVRSCFPARKAYINNLGGKQLQGSEGLSLESNIETGNNKLLIFSPSNPKDGLNISIAPITKVVYGRNKRSNGVDNNVTLYGELNAEIISTGQKTNSNGNTLINTTNKTSQKLSDAKASFEREVRRRVIEQWKKARGWSDTNARSNEINGLDTRYIFVWVKDLKDANDWVDMNSGKLYNLYPWYGSENDCVVAVKSKLRNNENKLKSNPTVEGSNIREGYVMKNKLSSRLSKYYKLYTIEEEAKLLDIPLNELKSYVNDCEKECEVKIIGIIHIKNSYEDTSDECDGSLYGNDGMIYFGCDGRYYPHTEDDAIDSIVEY